MDRELIITSKATRSWQKIALYLRNKFGEKSANVYSFWLLMQLNKIAYNPQFYRMEIIKESEVSFCVFKKETIIQFVFTEKEVVILAILDARSNWKLEI